MARNKYPEHTITKILDVSTELFAEKGYDNVIIQDIVDRLEGMTKGAIYHHFKGKDEIYEAIIDRLMDQNNIFARIAKLPGLNGLQRIQKVVTTSMEGETQMHVSQIAYSALDTPRFLKKQLQDCVLKQAPYIRKFIEEGNRDGSLSVKHPEQAAEIFMLMVGIWLNPGIFPSDKNEQKLEQMRLMLDSTGMPVLTDEIIEQTLVFLQGIST